MIQANTNKQQK